MAYIFSIEDNPTQQVVDTVRGGLSAYNIAQTPEILEIPHADIAVIKRDGSGRIVGGVSGEISWGWLYIDTVWVDETWRRHGLGRQLMQSIEQVSVEHGVPRCYLTTTSFQARPFYEALGYTVWGELKDFPPDHSYYFLRRDQITPSTIMDGLEIQNPPNRADKKVIVSGLVQHAYEHVPLNDRKLSVLVHDSASGELLGGLIGATYWGWFDLRYLWIDSSVRGQGIGRRLIEMAENECVRRGVYHMFCDTAGFQSLTFYRALGFEIIGTLEDRPPGHTSYFIRKTINLMTL